MKIISSLKSLGGKVINIIDDRSDLAAEDIKKLLLDQASDASAKVEKEARSLKLKTGAGSILQDFKIAGKSVTTTQLVVGGLLIFLVIIFIRK